MRPINFNSAPIQFVVIFSIFLCRLKAPETLSAQASAPVQPLGPASSITLNLDEALEQARQRLFVGCRKPAKLLVLNTKTGRLITSMEIDGDTDDLFYDSARKYIYVIRGTGFIDVIQQNDPDHYLLRGKISTATRARTGLFVPSLQKLFLAVPHRDRQPADIRVYESLSR
jgi:hypothetical protein